MDLLLPTRTCRALVLLALAALVDVGAAARDVGSLRSASFESDGDRQWTVDTDNDLFAFTNRDRDYTAGLSVTLSERGVWHGAQRCRAAASGCTVLEDPTETALADDAVPGARALEIGMLLFTPQDLGRAAAVYDDRPYASLFYASLSKLRADPAGESAFQSTLTVGVLGLPLAADVHRRVHEAVGATLPEGYSHQISAGGEPTFRFAATRYRALAHGRLGAHRYALRLATAASFGFLTELDAGLAFRWGNRPAAPWDAALADAGDYAGQPAIAPPRPRERATFELSAGITARARLYDAFVQGQFRRSDVAYPSAAVEHLLGDAWIGVDVALRNGLRIDYIVRRRTRELAVGRGARSFTWAGVSMTRSF